METIGNVTLDTTHYVKFDCICKLDGITGQRENFHRWLKREGLTGLHSIDDWRCLFLMFTDIQDARDAADTNSDCLGVLF